MRGNVRNIHPDSPLWIFDRTLFVDLSRLAYPKVISLDWPQALRLQYLIHHVSALKTVLTCIVTAVHVSTNFDRASHITTEAAFASSTQDFYDPAAVRQPHKVVTRFATDMFVVVVTLRPKPLPSLGLDERFTRIDYTAK